MSRAIDCARVAFDPASPIALADTQLEHFADRNSARATGTGSISSPLPFADSDAGASAIQNDHTHTIFAGSQGARAGVVVIGAHSLVVYGELMRNRQSHVVDTLRQVQVFLDTNAAIVGPTIASSRRSLDDVVTRLTAFAADQETSTRGSRGETARQRVLRAALRTNHMRPIAEVAKQKLRDVPEFKALTMPPANATSTQLVAAAAAMADAAVAHETVFTDVGMPDDFVASLRAAASAVSQSIDGRKQHAGKRNGATAGLAAEEKRGRSMIRLIDAIVVPKLGSNDALLAEWKSAKRVPRKTGPVATVVASAAASPATVPSTAAAAQQAVPA